jgi:hypothetical protein
MYGGKICGKKSNKTLIHGRKFCCQRNIKRQLRHNSPSFMGQTQVLPKQANFEERNELPQFLLTFYFATLHTRIVVPQFQNSLVEMCHEAEVSSSQAALRMRLAGGNVPLG